MFWLYIFLFLCVIYEYFTINEDFLFLISFLIFFVNVVSAISDFTANELINRQTQLKLLLNFNISLNKFVLYLNNLTLNFLNDFDLEQEFVKVSLYAITVLEDSVGIENVVVEAAKDTTEYEILNFDEEVSEELNSLLVVELEN
jgi:hypothetical protein